MVNSMAHPRPRSRSFAHQENLQINVLSNSGHTLLTVGDRPGGGALMRASAPMRSGTRTVGMLQVSTRSGGPFAHNEHTLARSLDRNHIVASVVSLFAALFATLVLSLALTRPLTRIGEAARRIRDGDLDTRLVPRGSSEMRQIATTLTSLADTLSEEEQLRRQTVGDLAHELRTPVACLLSYIEAAQDGVLDLDDNLNGMHTETLRLARLLNDLSQLADAEQPRLFLTLQPVNLADIAQAQSSLFAERFAEAGIEVTTSCEAAPVNGDTDRLAQVVANLLSNALAYTNTGGRVAITTRVVRDESVLEMRDTGIGIPAELLPHIFTRFWRGDRSRSRTTGGAGIGLAIVAAIVRHHGGRIDVSSSEGEGTIFTVSFLQRS